VANIHLLNDLLDGEGAGEVVLVSEDEDGDRCELGLLQQILELCLGGIELVLVYRVNDKTAYVHEQATM